MSAPFSSTSLRGGLFGGGSAALSGFGASNHGGSSAGLNPSSSSSFSSAQNSGNSSNSSNNNRSSSPLPSQTVLGGTSTQPASRTSQTNSPSSNQSTGGSSTSSTGVSTGGPSVTIISSKTIRYSNAASKYWFPYQSEGRNEIMEIRNVWAENVEAEMAIIRQLIETHPYIAMDTEFPGIVARPVSESYSPDFHYKSLKVNVDLLKIIQLGLSFADAEGHLASGCPCWQFNFKFNLNDDMFAQDSIDLLVQAGISFEDHATRGIDPLHFGELLMVSGLVLDDRVKWISFHSGFDYGYLLKLLTTQELPNDEKGFFETLKLYFPTIYDVKYMTSLMNSYFGGLQRLADTLGCPRVGAEHQAGSDSLLTMTTYFALAKANFSTGDVLDDSRYKNELYGYGNNHTARKNAATAQYLHSSSSIALNGGE